MTRYRIEGPLGEGAMGSVFRAFDQTLQRPVAIKVLKGSATEISRKRFLREARLAAAFSHPNLVSVLDAGENEHGQLQLVMELVEGQTLAELIDGGQEELPHLMELLERVSRGVHYAHGKGIVHRDLKPANILVSTSGSPKVSDFGLAHVLQADTILTNTGSQLGSPLYMSPEQAQGLNKEIDARSDVYSLGVILYEMATGRPPFEAKTVMDLYKKIVGEEPARPRDVNPSVEPDLERIILKAIRKKAADRYKSAEHFADDLRRHLLGRSIQLTGPVAAVPRVKPPPPKPAARISPLMWILGSVALAGIVTSTVLLTLLLSRPAPTTALAPSPSVAPAVPSDQQIRDAHALLIREALPALQALEDYWWNVDASSPTERLAKLQETTGLVERKYPAAASPRAWRQLGEIYANRTTDPDVIGRMLEVSAEDPFPALLKSGVLLSVYARKCPVPDWTPKAGVMTLIDVPVSSERGRVLAAARGLFDGGRANFEEARLLSKLFQVVEKFAVNSGEAERLMGPEEALSPWSGLESLLRAHANFLAKRFPEAAARFDRHSNRGWAECFRWSARAWLLSASSSRIGSDESVEAGRKSYEWCDRREQGRIDSPEALEYDRGWAAEILGSDLGQRQSPEATTWNARAIVHYMKVTQVNGLNMKAWVRLASSYVRSGRHEDALKLIERGPAGLSGESRFCLDIGVAFSQLGRHPEALSWFEKGQLLDPGDEIFRLNIEATRNSIRKQQEDSK